MPLGPELWLVECYILVLFVALLIGLAVVVILLLNGLEVSSVGGGALLERPCMVFQRMSVLCL